MALVPFDRIIDRVLAELPGNPPALLVREEVIAAMQEFCTKSWAWNVELDPQSLIAGEATYFIDLDSPKEQRPVKILRLSIGGNSISPVGIDAAEDVYGHPLESGTPGTPKHYTQRDPMEVILVPRPQAAQRSAMTMRVAICPTFEASKVSDALTEKWRDAIIHGALARMHAHHAKPWTAGDMASFHQSQFNTAIESAREEVQRGLTRAGGRTKARFL